VLSEEESMHAQTLGRTASPVVARRPRDMQMQARADENARLRCLLVDALLLRNA
jgi:hypothetical protein